MQQILTPAGAVSHLFSMFDFTADILFQVGISLGLAMLLEKEYETPFFLTEPTNPLLSAAVLYIPAVARLQCIV